MALRRKPAAESKPSTVAERQVEALIEKGGSVSPARAKGQETKPQLIQLRLPRMLVRRIDEARSRRLVAPSRHAWLLEALLEKLDNEGTTSR